MYNNLAGHAAKTRDQELRRTAQRPERLMAHELQISRRHDGRRVR